ncbi:MAG TPA: hypothetical protein VFD92_19340 [Candidatus Binatia bacterium]|nr:hypothetical protein [Candidatus Binatia bacterium]
MRATRRPNGSGSREALGDARSRTWQAWAVAVIVAAFALRSPAAAQTNVVVNAPALDTLGDHTTQSETSLAVHGSTVCAGYNSTRAGDFPSPLAGLARSGDAGDTWADEGYVSSLQGSDPSLAVHRASGRFYYASTAGLGGLGPSQTLRSIVGVSRSTDDCVTFVGPANATPSVGAASVCAPGTPTACTQNSQCAAGQVCTDPAFEDKPTIAVDNSGGARDGNVYACWTHDPAFGEGEIHFSRSTDAGVTFTDEQVLSPAGEVDPFGCTVAVGPNGEVYAAWGTQSSGNPIRFRRSLQGGAAGSWDPVVQVNAAPTRPSGRDRVITCVGKGASYTLNGDVRMTPPQAWMAVDTSNGPSRGSVYVVWQSDPAGAADNSDVYFSRSTNGGVSFLPEVQIAGGTVSDQFLPNVAVADDGVLSIVWYDRRLDPANLAIDVYRTVSFDGGESFDPIRRLTSQSSPVPPISGQPTVSHNFDPARSECYLGDYLAVTADGDSFYYAWGDNRRVATTAAYPGGRNDPDVMFTRLPLPDALPARAFLTANGTDTVEVVDVSTDSPFPVASVPVGDQPFGVAVNHSATHVWVTNRGANTVSVIDAFDYTVVATIPVGATPTGIALDPEGTRAYVANFGDGTVSVIDTALSAVVATVPLCAGSCGPFGVAVNPTGTKAYVTAQSSNQVKVIDTATNSVSATIAVHAKPTGIAVNPLGTRAFAVPDGVTSDYLTVIDTSSDSVIPVLVGTRGPGVSVSSFGTRLYAAFTPDQIQVFDVTVSPPAHRFNENGMTSVFGIQTNADATRLYVANPGSDSLSFYDSSADGIGFPFFAPSTPVGSGTSPIAFGQFLTNGGGGPGAGAATTVASGFCSLDFALPAATGTTGTMTFDPGTTDVFGTSLDPSSAVGTLVISGGFPASGTLGLHFQAAALSFDASGSYGPMAQGVSFDLRNITGNLLPRRAAYRLDIPRLQFDAASRRYEGACQIQAFLPVNTPAGKNVALALADSGLTCASANQVEVIFDEVTVPGSTQLTATCVGPTNLPPNFSIGGGLGSPIQWYQDVSTTAVFTPPARVCYRYAPVLDDQTASQLRVLHQESGVWVDRTVLPIDTVNKRICAEVSSFSPFVVAETSPAGFVPPDSASLRCEQGVRKGVATLAKAIAKCNDKTASATFKGMPFDEEACEATARTKYDAAASLLTGCPACATSAEAALRAATEDLFDGARGAFYCAGTALLPGDGLAYAPPDPIALRCSAKLESTAAKLANASLTCQKKAADNAFRGKPFDDGACRAAARAKYDASAAHLAGCPPCVVANAPAIGDRIENAMNGARGDLFCAGSTPIP